MEFSLQDVECLGKAYCTKCKLGLDTVKYNSFFGLLLLLQDLIVIMLDISKNAMYLQRYFSASKHVGEK